MTLQEKLDFIDDEIKKLNLLCIKAGYTASQIESFAQPFFKKETNNFGSRIWTSGETKKRQAVAFVATVFVAVLLCRYTRVDRVVYATVRHIGKQILPLWDWAAIHTDECFVKNPLYEPMEIDLWDCELCETTDKLERVHNVGSDRLLEYKHRQVPVIVQDAYVNWGNSSNISIAQLAELYNTYPDLKDEDSCKFRTNIRGIGWSHITLMNQVLAGRADHFYAHWKNCDAWAAKALRHIYGRPYFLPSAFTLASSNWVFLSSNYSGKIFKPVEVSTDLLLLIQLKGQNHVNVEPAELCKNYCSQFEVTLQQGEILVVPTLVWSAEYLPSSSPENIAIAFTVQL
ncbi:hypothetical protein BsWGS_14725 [Bradybaena similaris]